MKEGKLCKLKIKKREYRFEEESKWGKYSTSGGVDDCVRSFLSDKGDAAGQKLKNKEKRNEAHR